MRQPGEAMLVKPVDLLLSSTQCDHTAPMKRVEAQGTTDHVRSFTQHPDFGIESRWVAQSQFKPPSPFPTNSASI